MTGIRVVVVSGLAMLAIVAGGCGGGSTTGTVTATIGAQLWSATGSGSSVTAAGTTAFTVLGYTPVPNSPLVDSSKPVLEIVFPEGVPSAGVYDIDGVNPNVTYEPDVNTIYAAGGGSGTVQITSITASRSQGTFAFDLQSSTATPATLAVTGGTFDVPITQSP